MLCLILSLALSGNVWAIESKTQPTTPAKTTGQPSGTASTDSKKSKSSNTDIFEKEEEDPSEKAESSLKTLTAKVKVVRDDGEGREVFFTSDKVSGAFYLRRSVERYGQSLKILEASKKPQGAPVTIRYDEDRNIKSVNSSGGAAAEKSPDEKWDFGEVPE